MPLDYDESMLKKAQQLASKSDAVRKSVAKLLKKIKDGFFSGERVVMLSGLSKAEVQQIIDAQDKTAKYLAKWQSLEKTFNANLKKAYQSRKKELEEELRSLDGECKTITKEFPEVRSLVGSGPERDLKKAVKQMI